MLLNIIFLIAGIAVLGYSADLLVEASSRLARQLGVSIVVVGAVIVGFGTSMPEMAVSTVAAARDDLNLATGNVIGSIIANLSLVLGGAALIGKIHIPKTILSLHVPLSMFSVFCFCLFIQGDLHRYEGFILLFILVLSLIVMVRSGEQNPVFFSEESSDLASGQSQIPTESNKQDFLKRDLLATIVSLVGVIVSSYFITEGSIGLAEEWGIGSGFVGASLVAVGTSLPELVASIAAVRKGKPEMILGTILGSNIFNGAAIGASMGIFGPGKINESALTGSITIGTLVLVAAVWIWKGFSQKPLGRLGALGLLLIYGSWMFFVGT